MPFGNTSIIGKYARHYLSVNKMLYLRIVFKVFQKNVIYVTYEYNLRNF